MGGKADEDVDEGYVLPLLDSCGPSSWAAVPPADVAAALASTAETRKGVQAVTAAFGEKGIKLAPQLKTFFNAYRRDLAHQGARLAKNLIKNNTIDVEGQSDIETAAETCSNAGLVKA